MDRVRDALSSAGIVLEATGFPPAVARECSRLARLLRESRVYAVGLVPAGDDVAVPGPALELARALATSSRRPAAVVDAMGTWKCGAAIDRVDDGGFPKPAWLLADVALLTLDHPDRVPDLQRLQACVLRGAALFAYLIVDLTGFDRLGESGAALDLLDAGAVVARSGRTTAQQLKRALADFAPRSSLGVLLTGA